MNKKKVVIIILSSLFILGILGFLAFKFLIKREVIVDFKLIGEENVSIEYGSKYEEEGYSLIVDEEVVKTGVKISDNINYDALGDYEIEYLYIDKYEKQHSIKRYIKIVDTVKPTIELKDPKEVTILVNEKYKEPGFSVKDNYDKELDKLVKVESNIDSSKAGEYTVKYSVCDLSNNCVDTARKVKVVKPKKVVTKTEVKSSEKTTNTNSIKNTSSNTILKNQFKINGIYYEGYYKNGSDSYIIKLKNDSSEYSFNMNKTDNNNYKGTIDFSNVVNGNYEVYINEEKLINKMELIDRIVRAKVGNKLITVNYNSNIVSINVEDFKYSYDVLIDVGHGGSDTGAVNPYVYEKDLNLAISLYEKCRYQELGYSVYITRTNDTYGTMMGDSSWKNLTRKSYAIGYYGVVSKVVYSNHNNSTDSTSRRGYEILTPAQYDSLRTEQAIASRFNSIYPSINSVNRMYARNYDTDAIFSTMGGQKYSFKNYYATIRIPYELFNTKTVTYEGFYLSNNDDYKWFWVEGNWKKVSEIKIEEYVRSLGGSYSSDTSCK